MTQFVVGDRVEIKFPRPPWWRPILRFKAWLWRRRFAVQEQKTYYVVPLPPDHEFNIALGTGEPPVTLTSSGSETLH